MFPFGMKTLGDLKRTINHENEYLNQVKIEGAFIVLLKIVMFLKFAFSKFPFYGSNKSENDFRTMKRIKYGICIRH